MTDFLATRSVAAVVTIDEVRAHLQLHGDTSFDNELLLMIEAAQQYAEDKIGEFLGSTVVTYPIKRFENTIELPHRYITTFTSIQYRDQTSGNLVAVPTSTYVFDNGGPKKYIKRRSGQSWPTGISTDYVNPIIITYTAQFTPLPAPIVHAVLMIIGDMFHSRWSGDRRTYQAPVAVDNLLFNYIRRGF